MPQPFPTNSNYRSVIRSLLRIHQLWVEGKGESPEADGIRDDDASWRLLSEVERKRVRGLSEDLNSISDPPSNVVPEMNPQAQAKLVEAYEARQRGDWDRALELLRRWGKHMAPSLLSFLRGSIWFFEAGDAETAAVFYRHAARLEPGNANYRALLLDVLQKAEPEKAIILAEEVIRDSEANAPAVVVHAAHVLFGSAKQMSAAEALPTYRRLNPILKKTLKRLEENEEIDSLAILAAISMLALSHDGLGDSQSALAYYSRGLQIDPHNDALLVARGMLLYGTSPRAAADFELAIQLGSRVVLPYFFLAHLYATNNRFDECRSICERALRKPASPSLQSTLFEWLAISQAGLGYYPTEVVRASFENALRVDPSNDYARRNFAAFEAALAGPTPQLGNWESRSASFVRTIGQEHLRKSGALATLYELAAA